MSPSPLLPLSLSSFASVLFIQTLSKKSFTLSIVSLFHLADAAAGQAHFHSDIVTVLSDSSAILRTARARCISSWDTELEWRLSLRLAWDNIGQTLPHTLYWMSP